MNEILIIINEILQWLAIIMLFGRTSLLLKAGEKMTSIVEKLAKLIK